MYADAEKNAVKASGSKGQKVDEPVDDLLILSHDETVDAERAVICGSMSAANWVQRNLQVKVVWKHIDNYLNNIFSGKMFCSITFQRAR